MPQIFRLLLKIIFKIFHIRIQNFQTGVIFFKMILVALLEEILMN